MSDTRKKESSQRNFGLIGCPVSQSLSPALFSYIFHELSIDADYTAWNVESHELKNRMVSLRSSNLNGLNVTIPHKSAVISYLDEIDPVASRIGAVNCIHMDHERLRGYNTDHEGIHQTLLSFKSLVDNSEVLILGAGGAARAVVFALLHYFDPKSVFVCNRTYETANKLINNFTAIFPEKEVKYIQPDRVQDHMFKVLINCLPPEYLTNFVFECKKKIFHTRVLFDVNYYGQNSDHLKISFHPDMVYINGLRMLAVQAAESFKIWTGAEMPLAKTLEFLNSLSHGKKHLSV